GEDIISDEGDEGLPADEGDCCDCLPGGLLEEQVLERPRGGDGGEGDGDLLVLDLTGTEVEAVTADDELAQECGGVSRGSMGISSCLTCTDDRLGDAGAWRGRSGWDGSDVAGCRSQGASVPECRAAGVLNSSDWHEVSFVNSDGPWSAIRARLPITDEERSSVSIAVRVVTRDVDLLLGVEGVLKSRAVEEFVSHVDGGRKGSMQQEPSPRVREDKYRPLKC
ncbi:hypothetical protein POSPLADRAFT_1106523, partial [Postia placenta MAD-698-R-SB12]